MLNLVLWVTNHIVQYNVTHILKNIFRENVMGLRKASPKPFKVDEAVYNLTEVEIWARTTGWQLNSPTEQDSMNQGSQHSNQIWSNIVMILGLKSSKN